MTDKEKAIVMAHTGIAMLTGEKFSIFHKYIEDILDRPVWTHELADDSVYEEIKEKSKSDFIELCKNEGPNGDWNPLSDGEPVSKGYYLTTTIHHEVYCDYWNGENFERTESVIAWMPLPKPYEVKDDEDSN
jgi:hypothetical protein